MLLTAVLHAQFGGCRSGTVTDPNGAVIPNATVILTNPATGEQKTTTTGPSGFYTFGELPAGNFTVKASANGFRDESFTDVAVSAELPRSLNIKLAIGSAATTRSSSDSRRISTTFLT
jgi:hypothetical protein